MKASYAQLLKVTADEAFKNCDVELLNPGVYGALGFISKGRRRVIPYIAQISDAWRNFNAPPINVAAIARAVGANSRLRRTDLLSSRTIVAQGTSAAFHLGMSQLGIADDGKFCLPSSA